MTGKTRVCTKAVTEMLIRWRLETVRKLVTGWNVVLVTSNCNFADRLTWVPQRWYDAMKKEAEPVLRWQTKSERYTTTVGIPE